MSFSNQSRLFVGPVSNMGPGSKASLLPASPMPPMAASHSSCSTVAAMAAVAALALVRTPRRSPTKTVATSRVTMHARFPYPTTPTGDGKTSRRIRAGRKRSILKGRQIAVRVNPRTNKPIRFRMHVMPGDKVMVMRGKDAGKVTEVLRIYPKWNKILCLGVNYCIKHVRPQREDEVGQRVQVEAPMHATCVMHYDEEEGVPGFLGIRFKKISLPDGVEVVKKVRYNRATGNVPHLRGRRVVMGLVLNVTFLDLPLFPYFRAVPSDSEDTPTEADAANAPAQAEAEDAQVSAWRSGRPKEKELTIDSRLTLRSGLRMPRFGLGTWQAQGGHCYQAVLEALKVGYRLIDTAQMYGNEAEVGRALQELQIPREEVFIVTKLTGREHGRVAAGHALRESLEKLKLPYVDLFLIHSPRGGLLIETWEAMLHLRDAGLTKAVGVSNFGPQHLRALQALGKELPEVNQIELHCGWHQKETVACCQELGIAVMAYSPLARGKLFGGPLRQVAWSGTEAGLCIRWALQKGYVVIPKSVTPERIRSNATVFQTSLDAVEMEQLESLDRGLCTCPAARAMDLPWAEVADRKPKGKGKGKSQPQARLPTRGETWVDALR
ncbi:unnamed protein product [Effrenium voratum]|nr:unnamed protein product [Effrenium voratum]